MYLEIDEGFPKHRKTLRLRSIMRDPKAGWYMIDLWTWACRSCPDGNLTGISAYEIEEAANYAKCDGKLCQAMIDSGFLDADADGKPAGLHNWMDRTGGGIKSMGDAAAAKKLYRLHKDGKCDRQSCVHCKKLIGPSTDCPKTVQGHYQDESGTNPHKTSPGQSSQDKTSQEGESTPAHVATGGPIRPRTAHELEACMRSAIQLEQKCIWNPGGHFASGDARSFLEGFGDQLEAALPDIEAKILLFAKDKAMSPWTIRKFVDAYNGIGKSKQPAQGRHAQSSWMPPEV